MDVKKCPVSKVNEDCSIDTDCEPYKYGGTYILKKPILKGNHSQFLILLEY